MFHSQIERSSAAMYVLMTSLGHPSLFRSSFKLKKLKEYEAKCFKSLINVKEHFLQNIKRFNQYTVLKFLSLASI